MWKLNQLRTTGRVNFEKYKPVTSAYEAVGVVSLSDPAISILLWCCKVKVQSKGQSKPFSMPPVQYLGQLFNFSYKPLAPFKRDFRTNAVGARQLQHTYDAAGLDALLHSQNNQEMNHV